MSVAFLILATVTVLSALGAMTLRNPVHCALSLIMTFAGLAGLYLHLGAQFVGLVQVLVYIGAVAVLIVFAILLTRASEVTPDNPTFSRSWWIGAIIAIASFAALTSATLHSGAGGSGDAVPEVTVLEIGERLLGDYILPLEVIGLLLTAAMIGAVLIAMEERSAKP